MVIGIDISSIPYGTGVSNYTLNLVSSLASIDKKNTYKLFFSSLRRPLPSEIRELVKKHPNFKLYHYRLPPTLLHYLWNVIHLIPIEIFIGKCDIFHTSDWTQPPTWRSKTITTVHDLAPFLYPQWQDPLIIKTHSAKINRALNEVSHVICVTQNTQSDFLQTFPQYQGPTSVVYEAAEDKYYRFNSMNPDRREEKINYIKKNYDLAKYILASGTREPRKNLARLVEAFKLFKKEHPTSKLELAIAGKYGWGDDVDHFKYPFIKVLGFIPEKDMVPLHAGAFALAYVSLYEGFGLPLVKAMALGIPLITSSISSMGEIARDAALLVDPNSVESIKNAISLLYHDANLRKKIIKKELIRAKSFSWKTTAKKTLEVYQSLNC